jgi:hypothetical protein
VVKAGNWGDGGCGINRGEPENSAGVWAGVIQKSSAAVWESHSPRIRKSDRALSFCRRNHGTYICSSSVTAQIIRERTTRLGLAMLS